MSPGQRDDFPRKRRLISHPGASEHGLRLLPPPNTTFYKDNSLPAAQDEQNSIISHLRMRDVFAASTTKQGNPRMGPSFANNTIAHSLSSYSRSHVPTSSCVLTHRILAVILRDSGSHYPHSINKETEAKR